jgi:hypothetical protein
VVRWMVGKCECEVGAMTLAGCRRYRRGHAHSQRNAVRT